MLNSRGPNNTEKLFMTNGTLNGAFSRYIIEKQ